MRACGWISAVCCVCLRLRLRLRVGACARACLDVSHLHIHGSKAATIVSRVCKHVCQICPRIVLACTRIILNIVPGRTMQPLRGYVSMHRRREIEEFLPFAKLRIKEQPGRDGIELERRNEWCGGLVSSHDSRSCTRPPKDQGTAEYVSRTLFLIPFKPESY